MTCVCGHSDDLHKEIASFEILVECTVCECDEFCEDIDKDELEIE